MVFEYADCQSPPPVHSVVQFLARVALAAKDYRLLKVQGGKRAVSINVNNWRGPRYGLEGVEGEISFSRCVRGSRGASVLLCLPFAAFR